MDAAQCRAARALLGISQEDLAQHSKVAKRTIASFEKGGHAVAPRTHAALIDSLEVQGIVFLPENGNGSGVALKKADR